MKSIFLFALLIAQSVFANDFLKIGPLELFLPPDTPLQTPYYLPDGHGGRTKYIVSQKIIRPDGQALFLLDPETTRVTRDPGVRKNPTPNPTAQNPSPAAGNSPSPQSQSKDHAPDSISLGNAANAGLNAAVTDAAYRGLSLLLSPSLDGAKNHYDAKVAEFQEAQNIFDNTLMQGASQFQEAVSNVMKGLSNPIPDVSTGASMNTPMPGNLQATPNVKTPQINRPVCALGSIIRTDNLSVGESVPVVGTPFNLVYFSDRVVGRKDDTSVSIPLIGPSSFGISTVDLQVTDRSGTSTQSFDAKPNLIYQYIPRQRESQNLSVTITYRYMNGKRQSASSIIPVGHWMAASQGLGGWTLSVAHQYDFTLHRLYLGNGMIRNVLPISYRENFLITNEAGTEAYIFDSAGTHLKTVNTMTGSTIYSFAYDQNKQLVSVTDAYQNVTTIRHHGEKAADIQGPFGQMTQLTFNSFGWLTSITNPAGEAYRMTSSPTGLLLTFTKPSGVTSTMTYDALGMLKKDESQTGVSTTLGLSFNEKIQGEKTQDVTLTSTMGRQRTVSIGSKNNNTIQTLTDARGYPTKIVDANEGESSTLESNGFLTTSIRQADSRFGLMSPVITEFTYGVGNTNFKVTNRMQKASKLSNTDDPLSASQVDWQTNSNGAVNSSRFDSASKTLVTRSAEGIIKTQWLDNNGHVIAAQLGNLKPIQFSYDSRGRLSQMVRGNNTFAYRYDNEGNLAETTTSVGTTRYQHDRAGRVTSQVNADGASIEFAYDRMGHVTKLTTPTRHSHSFDFGQWDSMVSYLAPDAKRSTSYRYNQDGQITELGLPDGRSLQFDYDSAGTATAVRANDASIEFGYSKNTGQMNLTKSSDGVVTHSHHFGPFIDAIKVSGPVNGMLRFRYNANLQPSSLQLNSLPAVQYGYNRDNAVVSAGRESLNRNSSNGLIDSTKIDNFSDRKTFDVYGFQATDSNFVNNQIVFETSVRRDQAGRIVALIETRSNQPDLRFDYRYDKMGRLISVSKDGATISTYQYDGNGNRSGGMTDAQDRLIQMGSERFAYDDNGNLVSKTGQNGAYAFRYDSFGNLKAATTPHGNIDYIVDGQNRRVGKKINGVFQQGFLYQSQLQIAAELDGNQNVSKQFVYASKANVPDYMMMNGHQYAIVSDHLGSPRVVVDTNTGEIKQEVDYDEFGKVIRDTNPGFTPFGFAGGLYDRDTGLVKFGARDYDPETGRWTSKDPLLFAGGDTNLYGYVLNDPINGVDPTGLFIVYAGLGGSAAASNSPGNSTGSSTSGFWGVAFDTSAGGFSFNVIGNGNTATGLFTGANASIGFFNGSKEQFLGNGVSSSVSIGAGSDGMGGSYFEGNDGGFGMQFDLFGPGVGAAHTMQNTCTSLGW